MWSLATSLWSYDRSTILSIICKRSSFISITAPGLHRCAWWPSIWLWLSTLRCFTSHCHNENTISGSHQDVRLIKLMYSKHQVWPVLDYNEILSELTENWKVSSESRCMYMSVKHIGKRCYIHCKSSKPVKRIILNLCINYHIKRWFAQSEVSSSLSSYDRLCMNEIEAGAGCRPTRPKTWLAPDLRTSRRKVEAGAHIAHLGSPVFRRDTIATTTAKNADLFPLRAYHWGLESEWPRSSGLRLCARLAASTDRKIRRCNMRNSRHLNAQQWTKKI